VPDGLSPEAHHYINTLRPSQRAIAREWAEVDDDEFKARIGVAVDGLGNGNVSRAVYIKITTLAGAAGAIGGAANFGVNELIALFT
jgi:hypothetical protein